MAVPIYTFLSVNDFPQIRAAIDPALAGISGTAAENPLPDSLIQMEIYLGYAESWLLTKLPLAADYTGDNLQRVKSAITLYVAALLLPTLPAYTKEDFGDYKYTRTPADVNKLAASLRLRAIGLLAPLTFVTGIPPAFDVACGDRGL